MRNSTVVRVRSDVIDLSADGQATEVRVPLQGLQVEDLAKATEEALAEAEGSVSGRVNVELDAPWCQRRRLKDVPRVPDRHLPGLLENRKDRYFRGAPETGVYGARWSTEGGADVLHAAVVDSEVIEALTGVLKSRSVRLGRFSAAPVPDAGAIPLRTADWSKRQQRRAVFYWTVWTGLAVIPWVVQVGVYAADLILDRFETEQRLSELTEPLEIMSEIERDLRKFEAIATVAKRQGPESGWVGRTLLAVARSLPVTAHLHSLTADSSEFILHMHAASPDEVLDSLSSNSPFQLRTAERSVEGMDSLYSVTLERGR